MARRGLFRCVAQFNARKDYYQTLQVAASAAPGEIKKAYHELAKRYHPDAKTGNEEKFKEIAEAFEVLSDEHIKAQYDAVRFARPAASSRPAQESPFASSFAQASREEKLRKAAAAHEEWKKAAGRAPPLHFSPWGQRGHPARQPYDPEKSAGRPEEAWIYELMAAGILAGLFYWTVKAVYAMFTAYQRPVRMVQEPRPSVFAQRRPVSEPEFGPLPKARTTRSTFPSDEHR